MYLNLDLLNKFCDNHYYFDSLTHTDSISIKKGYRIIDHAYDTLSRDDELYLADAIANLRKAINYRVAELFQNLGLEYFSFNQQGKKRKLEKLGELGIIKPLLINKLLEIRNGIEYNGNDPPNKQECEELIDIVWYFYRSTDRFCNIKPDELNVEWQEDGKRCFLGIEFDFSKHSVIKVSGRFPKCYISEEKRYSYSILLEDIVTQDCSENSFGNTIGLYHAFHKTKIKTKNLDCYSDLFYIVLSEWGI